MNQFLSVTNVLSKIILVFGFTMLVPYGVAYWSEDGSSVVFGEAILMTMSCFSVNMLF